MTQIPGKAQTPGTDVVAHAAPRKTSLKKGVRAVGAGVVAAGLFGVFALPAYASTLEVEEQPVAYAQALTTGSIADIAIPAEVSGAEEEPLPVVVQPSLVAASGSSFSDLPAGVGAPGIANAALAQLGWAQDCTDLVQNSLAAVGLTQTRENGGYDHGVHSFDGYGAVYAYDPSNLAPGDLLVWPGAHIAVYVGGGQVVHGGWGGTTVLAGPTNHGAAPAYVIRIG